MVWNAWLRNGRNRVLVALLALASALSAWMALEFAGGASGYVAGYTNAAALLFAFAFALVGFVLLIWRRTRWYGVVSMGCAIWLMTSYLVAVNALYHFDLVVWKHERMVSLLPQRNEGYYIYFRPGTPEIAIEAFSNEVLHEPPSARGQDLKPGIRGYARVTPVDGRETIAIGLEPKLTPEQRRDLRSRIEAWPMVSQVADGPLPRAKP
jgi:hypothetical protein